MWHQILTVRAPSWNDMSERHCTNTGDALDERWPHLLRQQYDLETKKMYRLTKGAQPTWAKICKNISKEFMSHILQKWMRWINIYILAVFQYFQCANTSFWGDIFQRSVFSCEASNLRGLGFLDTAFKRRRPRWKRAKSGSWRFTRIKNHPCLEWIVWFIHDKCLKNRWVHEFINFNSTNGDAYPKCTNWEFKSKNENQWKLCRIWITIAESMGVLCMWMVLLFDSSNGYLNLQSAFLHAFVLQISANMLNKDSSKNPPEHSPRKLPEPLKEHDPWIGQKDLARSLPPPKQQQQQQKYLGKSRSSFNNTKRY